MHCLCVFLFARLVVQLIVWMFDCLVDWLNMCLIGGFGGQVFDCLFSGLIGYLVGWLIVGCVIGWLTH